MTNEQRDTTWWRRAVERNREALVRILGLMFAMAGLHDRATVATLPRARRNAVLSLLRPAESAVRRLVVIAALGICVTVREVITEATKAKSAHRVTIVPGRKAGPGEAPSPISDAGSTPVTQGASLVVTIRQAPGVAPATRRKASCRRSTLSRQPESAGAPSLPILDVRKRFRFTPPRRDETAIPRITCLDWSPLRPVPDIKMPAPDDPVDAARICRRLQALKHALDDLDAQARRLARWRARRARRKGPGLREPLRPGWPPGFRKRGTREIDAILLECHGLMQDACRQDTS